jgi:lipopolysaccharide/colanic/teichoic acid biosynthesis glycosyltransferase
MVCFMPALTRASFIGPRSIRTYEELVSNWLIDAGLAGGLQADPEAGGLGRRRCKRAVDVAGAAVLLLLLLPALSIVLALVWATGGAPIYGHERVGRGGRPFLCWKVRTMVPDAEARLAAILRMDRGRAEEWARDHKLRDDPRVTRLGRWLRLTSLDEVPQLWNVLRGEMSLVGPRPVTRPELARYGASARHYLAVRPGITGLWQLDGRNALPYARRVLLDRFYVMKPSIRRDFALLSRTPLAIARRTGR